MEIKVLNIEYFVGFNESFRKKNIRWEIEDGRFFLIEWRLLNF